MANIGVSSVKIHDNDGDIVSVTDNRLDVNANLTVGGTALASAAATNDSSPDLDGLNLLGTHALLSARYNATTTAGLTCEDSVHNSLHVSISDGEGIANVDSNRLLVDGQVITGGADGVTTVTTAGSHVELASSTVCRKVDIQAQTDNTGAIAVGFDAVDATIATGTGILLYAGDVYSLEISNLNLIYIDSTVSGEGVRYTYFT